MTYPRMFAVCALLFSFRAWQRFIHMELWAEDGALYLAQALEHGLRSLTFTYGGVFHPVPRALRLFWLRPLPLKWVSPPAQNPPPPILSAGARQTHPPPHPAG